MNTSGSTKERSQRYYVKKTGFWWRVFCGTGTMPKAGKYHTEVAALRGAADLESAYLDGVFVGHRSHDNELSPLPSCKGCRAQLRLNERGEHFDPILGAWIRCTERLAPEPSKDAARWREFVLRARDIIRPELMAQWQASEIPSALAFVFDGMVAERLSGEPAPATKSVAVDVSHEAVQMSLDRLMQRCFMDGRYDNSDYSGPTKEAARELLKIIEAQRMALERRQPSEPVADAARLDWLEQQILCGRFEVAQSLYRSGFEFGWHRKDGVAAEVSAGTLREAIDKQRLSETKEAVRTDCYGTELPPISESDGAIYSAENGGAGK